MSSLESRLNKVEDFIEGTPEKPGGRERLRQIEDFIIELKGFHKVVRDALVGSLFMVVASVIIAIIIYAMRLKI